MFVKSIKMIIFVSDNFKTKIHEINKTNSWLVVCNNNVYILWGKR